MKEILKYLRQLKSLSQEDVAKELGISRQSYIKYEKGSVIPNEETLSSLGKFYGVTVSFIKENKIPELNTDARGAFKYKIKQNSAMYLSQPQVKYGTSPHKFYDGVFDGETIRILNLTEKTKLKAGQHIKFYIENEAEEEERRKEALNTIQTILAEITPSNYSDDDPYYKKELEEALNEKYGFN